MKVEVSRSTARWFKTRNATDKARAKFAVDKIRYQIKVWEEIRRISEWRPLSSMYEGHGHSSTARRLRRLMHHFEAAGLVELRVRPGTSGGKYSPKGHLEFRVRGDRWQ